LVNQYRTILMNEDTDCGNEILCTSIAIKNALIATNEIISVIDPDANFKSYNFLSGSKTRNRKVMTQEELYKIASDSWEGCDGCNENDRMFWINGFMKAANLFGDIDNLPNSQQLEEKGQLMGELFNKLINNQQNLDPEFGKIISDNFNDLI
jgi:hypothetical protein